MKSKVAPFLLKLHRMLQQESIAPSPIVTWAHHNQAFVIHDLDALTTFLLPKYFALTKYKSFQRQLHYFGFRKWTKTMASVCTYSHPDFQRGAISKMAKIKRKKRQRIRKPQHPMESNLDDILDWFVQHFSASPVFQ